MARRKVDLKKLTREDSLDAKPVAGRILKREPLDNGGERITFAVAPSTMQRVLLRLPPEIERDFEFDAFGREIIDLCDGQKTVRYLVQHFTRKHRLDEHEAEQAVLAFLRTLMQRGLISMLVKV